MSAVAPWRSILETEEEEEEREAAPPSPGQPFHILDRLARKIPWWGLSLGIHLVMALVLGWFWVAMAPEDDEAVMVSVPRRPRVLPVMDRPLDVDPRKKILDLQKTVQDPVSIKDAEHWDRRESAEEEEFRQTRGDALDFVSHKPLRGQGPYYALGGGAGGGARYGSRLGGKRNLIARGGGGQDTEDAVAEALKWLARHQSPDGRWQVNRYTAQCNAHPKYAEGGPCRPDPGWEGHDMGVTGLAILAFLGAGHSHLSRDTYDGICFGDVVGKALRWMLAQQDPEGCLGPRSARHIYHHAIGTLALSEAYGLTGSMLFKDEAQKAIDFLIAAQNPGKGWRYSCRCGDNDTSVSGWAIMALKSAEISGLSFPKEAYDGMRAWLGDVTDEKNGRVGYNSRGGSAGVGQKLESMTAVGIMARIFMDQDKSDPRLGQGCDILLKNKPRWEPGKIDFYYWYYASLALFQYDGSEGPMWKAWNEDMKLALVKNQRAGSDGCRSGSWEPVDPWCGQAGRVYAVAINALTLEVYYRYSNVFGVR